MKLQQIKDYLDGLYKITSADNGDGLVIQGKNENIENITLVYDIDVLRLRKPKTNPDLVISHHPIFDNGDRDIINGFESSLFVAHLPMDSHPEIGHSKLILDSIGKKFRLGEYSNFGNVFRDWTIGYSAPLAKTAPLDDIIAHLSTSLLSELFDHYIHSPPFCSRIGVMSGGCPHTVMEECQEMKIDTLVVGEFNVSRAVDYAVKGMLSNVKDWSYFKKDVIKEQNLGINILCFGHEATELVGLYALKDRLIEFGYKGTIEVVKF